MVLCNMISLIKKCIELLERFAYISRQKNWVTSQVIEIPSVEEIQESKQLVTALTFSKNKT